MNEIPDQIAGRKIHVITDESGFCALLLGPKGHPRSLEKAHQSWNKEEHFVNHLLHLGFSPLSPATHHLEGTQLHELAPGGGTPYLENPSLDTDKALSDRGLSHEKKSLIQKGWIKVPTSREEMSRLGRALRLWNISAADLPPAPPSWQQLMQEGHSEFTARQLEKTCWGLRPAQADDPPSLLIENWKKQTKKFKENSKNL